MIEYLKRQKTIITGDITMKKVKIGGIYIGGGEQIAIQSMTTVPTADAAAAAAQVNELADAGCDIVRLAVPDKESAEAISEIKRLTDIPLVADIHFDYRLALECIKRGIDKVRINPGNLGGEERALAVAEAAKERGIPIRIGVNGGSLEAGILEKFGGDMPRAMVESAKSHIEILHNCNFDDIVVSLKSSDVKTSIAAYRLAAEELDCPLHLGVTEAGTYDTGIVKSAIGIGALLADGIGDTIRVSLTENPVTEVEAAKRILKSLGLMKSGVEIISCPTCARCKIPLIPIAKAVGEALRDIDKPIKVAVMGCVVNGPGEAKDADIGIAGGDGCAMLFKSGEILRRVEESEIVGALLEEIEKM